MKVNVHGVENWKIGYILLDWKCLIPYSERWGADYTQNMQSRFAKKPNEINKPSVSRHIGIQSFATGDLEDTRTNGL